MSAAQLKRNTLDGGHLTPLRVAPDSDLSVIYSDILRLTTTAAATSGESACPSADRWPAPSRANWIEVVYDLNELAAPPKQAVQSALRLSF
jgi:hypothetical protein